MLDMGYESGQSDPDWFDVMRPTKLPAVENEFGADGRTYAGVRQSRLGFKGFMPTSKGEIKTIFEFELFGVGPDAGQTTFRLRHAWGVFQKWGAGQTWSPFMDPDVFPNSIEYWGPNGMVFFRNVQVRYMPLMGDNEVSIALERPGASGDPGVLVGDPDLEITALRGRFPLPDLSAHYRMTRPWGHLQVAGILRSMKWDDTAPTPIDASGSATGWGINVSSNLKFDKDTLRLQVVYGEGIANYMNDATADVGATLNPAGGEALPLVGFVAFYDRTCSDRWPLAMECGIPRLGRWATGAAWSHGSLAFILAYLLVNLVVALVGVWAAGVVARHLNRKDPGVVVIDEVSGQLITYFALTPLSWPQLLIGFLLFRALDIWKPFPARQVESWREGWGIMADDWCAGLYAALLLWGVRFFTGW